MAANAPIVIADGQMTPVSHTFSPTRIDGDVASYEDRSVASLALQPLLSVQVGRRTAASPMQRVTVKLELPLGVDPVTGVIATSVYEIKARVHKNSTPQQRLDGAAYVKNLGAHAVIQAALKDLEGVW